MSGASKLRIVYFAASGWTIDADVGFGEDRPIGSMLRIMRRFRGDLAVLKGAE